MITCSCPRIPNALSLHWLMGHQGLATAIVPERLALRYAMGQMYIFAVSRMADISWEVTTMLVLLLTSDLQAHGPCKPNVLGLHRLIRPGPAATIPPGGLVPGLYHGPDPYGCI